jgi:hypothetical protein
LQQRHKFPFQKFSHYKAEDGVAQWRHLSRCDRTKPNPFKPDEIGVDGKYNIGAPDLYYIVDDDQALVARDDDGLRLFREQVSTWEYVAVKLTATGQTAQKPSKTNDDLCDAMKSVLALFGPAATKKTQDEEFATKLEEKGIDLASIQAIESEAERRERAMQRALEIQRYAIERQENAPSTQSGVAANPFRRGR